jgi:hypothetical protein
MGFTRGSLTPLRMTAHRLVIIAAALTVVVAAAPATALARAWPSAWSPAARHLRWLDGRWPGSRSQPRWPTRR